MKMCIYLSTIFFFFSFNILRAQKEPLIGHMSVNEVGITVDKFSDFETIDWEDVMSVFDENDPKDSINIFIEIKDLSILKNNESKLSVDHLKVAVSGLTEERKSLKEQIREKTQAMIDYIKEISKT